MHTSSPGGPNSDQFDLLIIGGRGCATAVNATARGLTMPPGECSDFAEGPSRGSTKREHGGVRQLVTAMKRRGRAHHDPLREALHERRTFLRGYDISREEALRCNAAIELRNLRTELQREGRLS